MATFSIEKRHRSGHAVPRKDVHTIATKFAQALEKEPSGFLRSVVLYGSCTTHPSAPHGDIDMLVVIDDIEHVFSAEVAEAYRLIVQKHVANISPLLHVNTLKLSNFWEYARSGDPVLISMLRDGVIISDKGVFGPMQFMLDQGKVRPTKEAIYVYYAKSGASLKSSQQHLLAACSDLYWAAIDAAHAALMSLGEVPSNPDHIADALEHTLVSKKLLASSHVRVMRELYHLHKAIEHREISVVSGDQYKVYYKETIALVEALRTIVETKMV